MQQLLDGYRAIPFPIRLLALLLFLAMRTGVDLAIHRRGATKWREYAFLLFCGGLGAAFGLAVDQLTVRLSPDYFVLAKGLRAGPELPAQVLELSLHAGCVAGLLLGGVLLIANNPRPGLAQLGARQLAGYCLYPLAAALTVPLLSAPVLFLLDPLDASTLLADDLGLAATEAFRWVWGIHAGVYLGAVLGAIAACVRIRRARRAGTGLEDVPARG